MRAFGKGQSTKIAIRIELNIYQFYLLYDVRIHQRTDTLPL